MNKTPFKDKTGKTIHLGDTLIMDDEDECIIIYNKDRYQLDFEGELFDTDESNNNRLKIVNKRDA